MGDKMLIAFEGIDINVVDGDTDIDSLYAQVKRQILKDIKEVV